VRPLFCLLLTDLQRAVPTERRRPCRGTYLHAILGDTIQLRRTDLEQRGEAVGQQLLHRRAMCHPEVHQRLGVHPNAATQPLKCDVLLAQPRQLAGSADSLHGHIKPQRQQDARVRPADARASPLPP